jgi:hypothetical protein
MRQILLILCAFLLLNVDGQISPIKVPSIRNINVVTDDTCLKVSYINKPESEQEPAYYLNGKLIVSSFLQNINPKVITDIKVERKDIEINSKKYYGQIFIKTDQNYQFNFISLTDIKLKYSKLKDAPTLFMVNNELINEDYDQYILDQNYLLRISIETIENPKENIRFNLIRVLTKTPENIKKVKEIRIRGDSSFTN